MSNQYDGLIQHYSDLQGFTGTDWLRFKAQIKAESAFDPNAVSSVGAKGLAQFMDPTWKEWGRGKDVFDPEANIDAQIRYMSWLLNRVTMWDLSFAAYNWGIGRVLKIWQDPDWKSKLPEETSNYIIKINKFFEEYVNGRKHC